ncbi:MAG: alpha-ribazole phosphatase [Bacteroidales bacterium]|nr:alpha-ribazole phosphatase [Bacteroidales bacterium]
MNIWLTRHTKVNVKPRVCYGQTDVDVAESFLSEAKLIKEQIGLTHFDKIYSSPLKRCKKLSEYLFNDEIIFDKRLMELNFGDWEMQEWDKITDSEYQKWMNDYIETPCLNGESFLDLHLRVSSFIEDLKKENHENVAIIAHGGSIRSTLTNIKNEKLEDAFKTNVDYGEIIKLELKNNHTSINSV